MATIVTVLGLVGELGNHDEASGCKTLANKAADTSAGLAQKHALRTVTSPENVHGTTKRQPETLGAANTAQGGCSIPLVLSHQQEPWSRQRTVAAQA